MTTASEYREMEAAEVRKAEDCAKWRQWHSEAYHHKLATALREAAEMREALEALVKCNEEHDAAIAEIIGHPPGWKDKYLDRARRILGRE